MVSRRAFLSAAVGLAVAPCRSLAGVQTPPAGGRWIDLHHHFGPPAWVADVRGRPLLQPANTRWTAEQSMADMDRGGVAAAVVSITNPGIWFGDRAQVRRLARACNEFGARLVADHPTRFGLFAAPGFASQTVTVVNNTRQIDVGALNKFLATRGMSLADGYGVLKGKTFRISNMGDETDETIAAMLKSLDAALAETPKAAA